MNDRYLCRAKRCDTGEWVEGYYAVIGEKVVIIEKRGEEFYDVEGEKKTHGNKIVEVDPSTICQCTGLKDKNGKLIWENDIVRCGKNCTVTWCDTFASWRLNTSGWMYSHFFGEACKPEDVEIVGNIFDNPELLEVGE